MSNRWFIALVIAVVIGGGIFLFKSLNKPLPGQAIPQLSREHVTDISNVKYNSDPPTSGPHFPVWAKKGVYDRVISDGHLIHSMEHGYIVISYNCTKSISNFQFPISNVNAEETATDSAKPLTKMKVGETSNMSFFTPENAPQAEVQLPEEFKSEICKKLVENLWDVGKDFQRVIVVPRPGMDSPIALAAWGRLDKMQAFNKDEVKDFISVFHNQGPERTNE